jgi:rare lipoprotein A (peptidoglycan hydrolase)
MFKKIVVLALLLMTPLADAAIKKQHHHASLRTRASFYAHKFQGRKMSNGYRYNKNMPTAASLHYPIGSLLVVRCVTTGKEVMVMD